MGMKTRDEIVTMMCYTARHDFGLTLEKGAEDFASRLTSGMTRKEQCALWDQMAQIFDNCIAPYMEFKNDPLV